MKTTVEIAEPLLSKAKTLARRERTTLRALIEEGLRAVLQSRRQATEFEFREVSFGGQGLQAPYREGRWDEIRSAAYEGRGG